MNRKYGCKDELLAGVFLLLQRLMQTEGSIFCCRHLQRNQPLNWFLAFSFSVFVIVFDNANINGKSTNNQFVVNDVFHNVIFFGLTEVEPCVTQTNIRVNLF